MRRTYWTQNADAAPKFPRVQDNFDVDVVVVGSGVTGVMTAYLLSEAGLRVAVVERATIGSGDTQATTAHLTFVGVRAAMMVCDALAGIENPCSELFDPHRTRLRGGALDYVRNNLDYPYYLVLNRLPQIHRDSLDELPRGSGRVLSLGEKVPAYRDVQGEVTTVSEVCPHLGCLVHWNDADHTWDCPCHGSRFHPTGQVKAGPAECPLKPVRYGLRAEVPSASHA